ncbi:peptidylprolyl isomerase [Candidatus Woesearchaeota archaeon]|nr:peptidylprolyl isomerase [Candidatus Woesearchaeota archaeon]
MRRRREKSDEETLDLKSMFTSFMKKKDDDEDVTVDVGQARKFLTTYGVMLLVLIPIIISIFFRAAPLTLPVADDWAQSTVDNYFKSEIARQVNQQNPNLPDINKQQIINDQYAEFYANNKATIEQQVTGTAAHFRSRMQDESGQTYLLAIDPYVWYSYTKNYIEYGHWGNEYVDGKSWFTLRNGREGQPAPDTMLFFSTFGVIIYKIMNIFTDTSVMKAVFLIPLVLMTIATAAAYFVGLRISGVVGALIASIIIGIHPGLLGRTAAGFSDTDNVIAFFEILVIATFFIAYELKNRKIGIGIAAASGILTGIYGFMHQSWWHTYDFILFAAGATLVFLIATHFREHKFRFDNLVKMESIRHIFILTMTLVVSTTVTILGISLLRGKSLLNGLTAAIGDPIMEPLGFMVRKSVAVTTVWPNVLTTVAELNQSSVSAVISQLGGKLLFALSIIGVIYLLLKKVDGERKYFIYGVLLALWYASSVYAAQSSVRFIAFVVPAFAFSLGAFAAFVYDFISGLLETQFRISKWATRPVVILLLFFIVLMPVLKSAEVTAKNEVPSMNDAWYTALQNIKADGDDGIITSWWDFGHWFVAIGERRVTFDGGDQGERIHWVGKSLLTDNEKLSVGILRMLNCGQEKAPHVLAGFLDGNTVRAIKILDEIMVVSRPEASEILLDAGLTDDQISQVLEVTHCEDLLPQYYIASDDMIGKAGVWGHFGSWNFTKASMFNKVHRLTQTKGVDVLMNDFGYDQAGASRLFQEIKTANADQWISPWPGYQGLSSCSFIGDTATCGNGLIVNLTTMDARLSLQGGVGIPYSVVYPTEEDIVEKPLANANIPISAVLIPSGAGFQSILADPLQADGMFTRLFFFDGHGLECFDQFDYQQSFTNNQIYVYKVDWSCSSKAVMPELAAAKSAAEQVMEAEAAAPQDVVEASHILLTLDNRTEEEAIALANEIIAQVNETNFADLARQYSEGPSAPAGGALGWFSRGMMVAPFEEAAFALEPGEVSAPVKTEFGYHIIYVTGKDQR